MLPGNGRLTEQIVLQGCIGAMCIPGVTVSCRQERVQKRHNAGSGVLRGSYPKEDDCAYESI
jgi:hypothetical protein